MNTGNADARRSIRPRWLSPMLVLTLLLIACDAASAQGLVRVRRVRILTGGPPVYVRGVSPAFVATTSAAAQVAPVPAGRTYVPSMQPGWRMGSWQGPNTVNMPSLYTYGMGYPGTSFGNGSSQVPGYFGGMGLSSPYVFSPTMPTPYAPGGFPSVPMSGYFR